MAEAWPARVPCGGVGASDEIQPGGGSDLAVEVRPARVPCGGIGASDEIQPGGGSDLAVADG